MKTELKTDRNILEKLADLADVTAMRVMLGEEKKKNAADHRRVLRYFAYVAMEALHDEKLADELSSILADVMSEHGGQLYYEALWTVLDIEHDFEEPMPAKPTEADEEDASEAIDKMVDRIDLSEVGSERKRLRRRLRTGRSRSKESGTNVMWS